MRRLTPKISGLALLNFHYRKSRFHAFFLSKLTKGAIYGLCMLLFVTQARGQCDNLSATTTYNGGAGIGDAFGQSFLIDNNCFTGNTLASISLVHAGNALTDLTVEIFKGQSTNLADRIYVQTNNPLPPGNFNTTSTIELGKGTGTLAVEVGQVYTITMTPIYGAIGLRYSDDNIPGQGYASNNGGFLSGNDLRISITGRDCNSTNFYDNLSATTTYNGGAGIGDAFGQSFLIDKTCFIGNVLTSFSFLHNGNASANLKVEIFEGQSIDPADRIYVQENNVIGPGNFNTVSTIALGSGTGTLAVEDGKFYTILLSPVWGLIGVRFSDNTVPGQGYASNNGGFMAGHDMIFSIEGEDCSTIDFYDNLSAPTTYNGGAGIGDAFGQSFLIDMTCFIGNAITSFSFLHNGNASANLKVEIFEGQSIDPADRIYVQENNVIGPGNFNTVSTIALGGGTGTLTVEDGKVYTILLSPIWGLIGVRFSDNKVPGQGYASNNGGFLPGNDMRFSIAGGNPCVATDNTPPVITLNGDNPQKVCLGDSYTEAGASATDACEINDPVAISGSVDVNTVGSYTITYAATDAAGNTATASRTVNVTGALALEQDNCPNNNPNCGQIRLDVCPYQYAPDLAATAMANNAYVSGASLSWYDFSGASNPPGAQLPGPPAIDMESPATNTNVWVTQTLDGCESDPTQMRVRVKPDKDENLALDFTGISMPTCGGATINFLSAVSGYASNVSGFMFYKGKPNQGGTLLTSTSGTTVANVNDPYFYAPVANGTNDYYVQSIMKNANQCGGEASDEVTLSSVQATIIDVSSFINGNSGPTLTMNSAVLTVDHGDEVRLVYNGLNVSYIASGWRGTYLNFRSSTSNSITVGTYNTGTSVGGIIISIWGFNGNCAGDGIDIEIRINPCTNCRSTQENLQYYDLSAHQLNNNDIAINWDVQFDQEIVSFEVEREMDNEQFEKIGQQIAVGNGSYQFIDRTGIQELNRYRIKIFFADGGALFTEPVEVNAGLFANQKRFEIYPNPTTDLVQVEALFPMEEAYTWQLTDMVGKTVMTGMMQETEMSLDMSRLPNGVYQFVTISREGARTVNRIVKQ